MRRKPSKGWLRKPSKWTYRSEISSRLSPAAREPSVRYIESVWKILPAGKHRWFSFSFFCFFLRPNRSRETRIFLPWYPSGIVPAAKLVLTESRSYPTKPDAERWERVQRKRVQMRRSMFFNEYSGQVCEPKNTFELVSPLVKFVEPIIQGDLREKRPRGLCSVREAYR